ncbi:aminotransferase class IV [Catenulispora sp. NF23]|uniref:aminotransferase class IV n=1 Tax=Catenulispora pinistramenti TaxID=2705254 RepID=UPI001BA4A860|nr:aminotransferase class IV [Catenulispora pinistramenti]MBS2533295.1 aminotransferase class IV [Catenulispora pinistramenti]
MYEVDPPLIWWNGEIVPWQSARVHVTSETALRGLNVFEGIRGYWWHGEQQYAVIRLSEHLQRLAASADLLGIPIPNSTESLAKGIGEIIRALNPCRDVYLRPTVYVDSGRYTSADDKMTTGAFIACHLTDPRRERPISCTVSSVRRIPDDALSALAKTGAAYTAFRMARLEALRRGTDEAILMSADGHVTETAGAAVFVLRAGRLTTPPLSDGVLDSLTRRAVIQLAAHDLGLTVHEQSISRSELYTADEIFIAGTLDEIRLVASVDGHTPRDRRSAVGKVLRSAYLQMCTGEREPIDPSFLEVLP